MKSDLHPDAAIIDAHGGPTKVAERMGLTESGASQRVWNWTRRGIPPAVRLSHPWLLTASSAGQQEVVGHG